MTWLTEHTYQLSFSLFPKIFNIKDGWIIKLINLKNLDLDIFEKRISKDILNPYKILIKEKTGKNKLKLLHINGITAGDTIKIDKDIPDLSEFLLYYEVIEILPETNEIILNRPVLSIDDLTFLERSNLTGIYYFDFTPDKPGFYQFEISNPKYQIKPFGVTIEAKDQFYIKELINNYTSELNKKFNVKEYDPKEEIEGVKDPIWFNNKTGKVWIWDGSKWITAD